MIIPLEDSQNFNELDEQKIQDTIGVLKSPLYKTHKFKSEQVEFIRTFLKAPIIEEEISSNLRSLAELIVIRREQRDVCPECLGGIKKKFSECDACHGTGEKNIYK